MYFCGVKNIIFIFIVLFSIEVYGQEPTQASSNITYTDWFCTEITINWTKGNGTGRVVFLREGSAVGFVPVDDVFYRANDSFSKGELVDVNTRVVYNSVAGAIRVQGLKPNTTYFIAIFEYNSAGSSDYNYLTSVNASGSFTTNYVISDFERDKPYQCFTNNEFKYTEKASKSGSDALNYVWNFPDGTTATTGTVTKSYATSGYKDVKLTVRSPGCQDEKTIRDTVAPFPQVDFILEPDSNLNTVAQCFLKPDGSIHRFYLKNNSTIGTLPNAINNTYPTWIYGDGLSRVEFNTAKSYALPGVYDIKLIISSTFNNGKNFCTDSITKTFFVNPPPLKLGDLVKSKDTLCLNNNSFVFNNTSASVGTSTWYFGDGNSDVGKTVSHSYTAEGKFLVKLEMVDNAGCYGELFDSVYVIPKPNNYFDGLLPTYCLNDPSTQLIPNLNGGFFEGVGVDKVNSVYTPNQVGVHDIRYIYKTGDCFDTALVTTEVLPLPEIELGNDTTLCDGQTVVLSVDPALASVSWSTGATSSDITVSSAGVYSATVGNGTCFGTDSKDIKYISPPKVDLGVDSTLCGGEEYVVAVFGQNANYVWNDGNTSAKRSFTQPGIYSVTISNICGTVTDSVELSFIQFGCGISLPTAFSPNGDALNDVFKPSGNITVDEMRIYNRWGGLVFWGYGNDIFWDGKIKGNLAKPGLYNYLITYKLPSKGTLKPQTAVGSIYLLY